MAVQLSANSYGKSDVRLTKVVRNGSRHELLEFSVDIQLTGDFAASYTQGDNSKVIATDSMKNIVYVMAKEQPFSSPEEFALILAKHFPHTYQQVTAATVSIRQTGWSRIAVDGKPHDHAFVSAGAELHTATATDIRGKNVALSGGIANLLVLKTTRSAFKNFVSDRYRTLKDADDRIFATSVTAVWDFESTPTDFGSVYDRIRKAFLEVFATHMSFAVQETMYEMGRAGLAAAPEVIRIAMRLPNKHRIPVNLVPFGLENDNEIFVWTDEPYGDISATVERE
jgi:urate oxidase